MTAPDVETQVWLIAAETALARRDRSWPGGLATLFHDDFEEIGASGRRWHRGEVIPALADADATQAELTEPRVMALADGVVLVTYRTAGPGASSPSAHRASIWIRVGAAWRIRYHQGTPAADE